jgi:hypothetical protein
VMCVNECASGYGFGRRDGSGEMTGGSRSGRCVCGRLYMTGDMTSVQQSKQWENEAANLFLRTRCNRGLRPYPVREVRLRSRQMLRIVYFIGLLCITSPLPLVVPLDTDSDADGDEDEGDRDGDGHDDLDAAEVDAVPDLLLGVGSVSAVKGEH